MTPGSIARSVRGRAQSMPTARMEMSLDRARAAIQQPNVEMRQGALLALKGPPMPIGQPVSFRGGHGLAQWLILLLAATTIIIWSMT